MTDPRTTEKSTGPAPSGAGRRVRALAAATAVAALIALGLAGWLCYDTYTYVPRRHEDISLLGVGYVVAAVIAVPATLALCLAAFGWWRWR